MKYHMSSTTAFILLLVTVPMPLISYADNSRTTLVGSCSNVSSGFCNEFTGSSYTTKAVQRTCEKNKMVFLSGACPVENRVGSCLVYAGRPIAITPIFPAHTPPKKKLPQPQQNNAHHSRAPGNQTDYEKKFIFLPG
jgi:hypothetical protein